MMRFSATTMLNCAAVTGAATMMFFGAFYSDEFVPGADGVDMMTTASVSAHQKAQPMALASQFTVINHAANRSCVMKLHRAEGYDVHRIEPSANCKSVTAEFAQARAWQENAQGTVTIVDRAGKRLMRLSRGDGFAWEVIEPSNLNVSLDAF